MRKIIFGLILVAAAVLVVMKWRRAQPPPPVYETAFAGEDRVGVWDSTAEVRETVATLKFGERVSIIERDKDLTEIRTSHGATGWVEERQLISKDVWQRASDLAAKAGAMPAQAFGHTHVPANLHLDPGRDAPRLLQLNRDVPVQMLARKVVAQPSSGAGAASVAETKPAANPAGQEWWMIRAEVKELGPVAGWTLAHFIALDAPAPLPDYSTAAAMRLIAWFTLNRVPTGVPAAGDDSGGSGGEKPQYLTAGLKDSPGAVCDFNMLRVYTWGEKRQRYETAFVDSNVCGELPIRVKPASAPGGDSEFDFVNVDETGSEKFVYQMRQTSVRRIEGGAPSRESSHTHKTTAHARRASSRRPAAKHSQSH